MRRVIVESPFAAPDDAGINENIEYARRAVRDSVLRGEAPIASHLLFTQPGILQDGVPEERILGMKAGLAWAEACDLAVFYADRGWSSGMRQARQHYDELRIPYETRLIGPRNK
jgi:hypothetical protein